jgi:hypothetical protein
MAFLSNQNKVFQDTVDYLHKIHTELPAARVRNYDIPTAVDILTSGTYLRMPSKMKVRLTLWIRLLLLLVWKANNDFVTGCDSSQTTDR